LAPGNKTTAFRAVDVSGIAIFRVTSTRLLAGPIFLVRHGFTGGSPPAQKGFWDATDPFIAAIRPGADQPPDHAACCDRGCEPAGRRRL